MGTSFSRFSCLWWFSAPRGKLVFPPVFCSPVCSRFMQDRKTLDDRAKMTELERLRHSAAHVMATAILRLWPEAQFAAGPPVENGFYYDVGMSHRIPPEDFH